MTIQAIDSTTAQGYVTQSSGSARASFRQDVKGLENALLNGDLAGAQSSFALLQQAISGPQASSNPNSVLSQMGQSSSALAQDLQAVSSALGAKDINGAQKAFAKLQQDIDSARQANGVSEAHHGHHAHHAKGNDGDADDGVAAATQSSSATAVNNLLQTLSNSSSTGSSANDLLNALQSLASSNPKVAGDLITLIKDMNGSGTLIRTSA
jgi:ribosomal protein S20